MARARITSCPSMPRTLQPKCYRVTSALSWALRHIAGVINPPAKNKRSHWIRSDNALPQTLEDWIAGADEFAGSWWTDWAQWLKGHAGKQIAAPKRYGKGTKFKEIEAAPGRYVLQKA